MRELVTGLLGGYKRWISPMLPAACRYQPTCSEFAQEAVAVHGVAYGSLLALWRLVRCHPLAKGGFDPVPHTGRGACAGEQFKD